MKTFDFDKGLKECIRRTRKLTVPALIVIAGGSCSGKGYITAKLTQAVKGFGSLASVLELDHYFRNVDDPDIPKLHNGAASFDSYNSYRHEEYFDDLMKLLSGRDVLSPFFDKEPCLRIHEKSFRVPARPYIIADGLYSIRILDMRYPSMLKVYVAADEETRLKRRIERDVADFGVDPKKVEKFFHIKVAPFHNRYIEPQRKLADIVIDNTRND